MNTNIRLSSPFTNIIDEFVSNVRKAIHEDVRVLLNTALGATSSGKKAAKPGATVKVHRTETKALSSARKVQGRYLGALRTATGNRRVKAKSIAKKTGVVAALKFLASSAPKN